VQGSPSLQAITIVELQNGIGVPAQGTQTIEVLQASTVCWSFVVQGFPSLHAITVVEVQDGMGVPAQGTHSMELLQASTVR
jgi:hypothetical protein